MTRPTIPPDPQRPTTTAQQKALAARVQNINVADIPKGPNNLVELGIYLRNLGISVTEHSLFGGVDPDAHKRDAQGRPISRHYSDRALDINIAGSEADIPWANAIFDQLASKLRQAGWQDILWKTPGHRNHMHIGKGGPETGGSQPKAKPSSSPATTAEKDAQAAETQERKLTDIGKVAPNSEKNVLNRYRLWNYNFAIGGMPAGMPESDIKDSAKLDKVVNDYHIIDSSGKFGKGSTGDGGIFVELPDALPYKDFLKEFNESSPGRYDLFIDDVVIKSSGGNGSQEAGPAATFNIDFTVFEPYGMSGFIEVLHAAAMATNWQSFSQMECIMKLWFTGYPDDIELPKPEVIPDSTRYYKIKLGEISSEVTEEGTKYRVRCISASDITFGFANHHFAPIQVVGNTVYDQVRNLFEQLNGSIKRERRDIAPSSETSTIHDIYEVSFPVFNIENPSADPIKDGLVFSPREDTPASATASHNLIVKGIMPQPGKDSSQPTTLAPTQQQTYAGAKDLSGRTQQPDNTITAQTDSFICAADRQIHQLIADIILRSNYVSQNVLQEQLLAAKQSPTKNTITYFKIKTESYAGPFDTVMNRYSRIYRYIVVPYEIHYTEIPGQEQGRVDYTPVLKSIKREYNYLFTGKNTDVIKYNIIYNNLATSAILSRAGNDASSKGLQNKSGPANTVETRQPESQYSTAVTSGDAAHASVPAPAMQKPPTDMLPSLRSFTQGDDPYGRFAQLLHDVLLQRTSMIESKFLSLELDILGDPFYLTSHNADYQPPKDTQTTGEGSARLDNTDVYINLNFKTPRDIHKNDGNPGLADFGDRNKLLPYSGIYRVFNIESSFKGGLFTQKIQGSRCVAQVITADPPQPAADFILSRSIVPGANVIEDSADPSVNRVGIRADSIDFSNFFNRGLPSVGLPGASADFTAAVNQTQAAVLTKVSGATAQFTSALGPQTADAVPTTSGIKISPSALQSAATDLSAAAVGVAGSMMEQVGNIQDAAKNLANDMLKQATSLSKTLEQDVNNLEDDFTSAVGDAKNAVQKLQNAITTDPSGVAAKLGIDPAKLSGLSKELSSKLTEELNKVADLVPPNANLAGLERAGVVFANMVGTKLANLPPLQPGTAAPKPIFDAARVAITDASGNVIPLLDGKSNLAALTEINDVKNSLGQASSAYGARLKSAAQVMLEKVGTVQLSVDNITALSFGVPNPVGSLNENSVGVPAPASVGLGSKENNSGRVDSLVQATANVKASQANITLAAQVGSKSATSPLTTLVQNSNIQGKIV